MRHCALDASLGANLSVSVGVFANSPETAEPSNKPQSLAIAFGLIEISYCIIDVCLITSILDEGAQITLTLAA